MTNWTAHIDRLREAFPAAITAIVDDHQKQGLSPFDTAQMLVIIAADQVRGLHPGQLETLANMIMARGDEPAAAKVVSAV